MFLMVFEWFFESPTDTIITIITTIMMLQTLHILFGLWLPKSFKWTVIKLLFFFSLQTSGDDLSWDQSQRAANPQTPCSSSHEITQTLTDIMWTFFRSEFVHMSRPLWMKPFFSADVKVSSSCFHMAEFTEVKLLKCLSSGSQRDIEAFKKIW